MKVKLPKLSEDEIRRLAEEPNVKVDVSDPWFIIVLKVVAYLIGLILAGMGTAQATTLIL